MRTAIGLMLLMSVAACQTPRAVEPPPPVVIQRVYFPSPPEILMRAPAELEPIKKEENGREADPVS